MKTVATLISHANGTCTVIRTDGAEWTYATAAIAGRLGTARRIDRRELDRFVSDAVAGGARLTYAS